MLGLPQARIHGSFELEKFQKPGQSREQRSMCSTRYRESLRHPLARYPSPRGERAGLRQPSPAAGRGPGFRAGRDRDLEVAGPDAFAGGAPAGAEGVGGRGGDSPGRQGARRAVVNADLAEWATGVELGGEADLGLLFGGKLPDGNGSPIFPICRQACLVPEQSTKGADLRQDEGTFLVLPFVLAGSSQGLHRKCVHSFAHSLAR